MPILLILLAGAALTFWLVDSEQAIPVFLGLCLFIFLLFAAPTLAWWFFIAVCVVAVGAFIIAFWEVAAGITLGIALTALLMLGLLTASARAETVSRDKVPYDECVEAMSDLLEVDYSTGWRIVKEDYAKNWSHQIRVKGNTEVEMTCGNGEFIINKGPHQIRLDGEVKTGK